MHMYVCMCIHIYIYIYSTYIVYNITQHMIYICDAGSRSGSERGRFVAVAAAAAVVVCVATFRYSKQSMCCQAAPNVRLP